MTDGAGAGAALGRHLCGLREQRGWTRAALSRESGVSVVTIRWIETGYPDARRRTHATLVALSRALGQQGDGAPGYPVPDSFEKKVLDRLDEIRALMTAAPKQACARR